MKEKNKKVALLLKVMIIGFALLGIWVYGRLVPGDLEVAIIEHVNGMMANIEMTDYYREYLTMAYWGLTILFACTGIPCYIVLALTWKMASTLEENKPFVLENAKRLKRIAQFSLINIPLGIVCIIAFWIVLDIYSELIYIMASACLFAIPFAIVTWALSYMIEKAAEIQMENDLTI